MVLLECQKICCEPPCTFWYNNRVMVLAVKDLWVVGERHVILVGGQQVANLLMGRTNLSKEHQHFHLMY